AARAARAGARGPRDDARFQARPPPARAAGGLRRLARAGRPRGAAGRRRPRPAPPARARRRARGPPPRPGRGGGRAASSARADEAAALRARDAAQPGRPLDARAAPAPRQRAQGAGGGGVAAARGGARMMLYVLRHGVAEEVGPEGTDGSRRLTPGGRRKLSAAAAGMRALGLTFDAILTSPLVRAAERAAIVAEAQGSQAAPRELSALEPGVPPVETVGALRAFARHEHVAIVGHEPSLSGVVAFLLTGSPDGLRLVLKKGGLVALEVHDPGRVGRAT